LCKSEGVRCKNLGFSGFGFISEWIISWMGCMGSMDHCGVPVHGFIVNQRWRDGSSSPEIVLGATLVGESLLSVREKKEEDRGSSLWVRKGGTVVE
jgi:hypothetical protein